MKATINFLKHKCKIKAYGRRLDLRPQKWPLKMLEILAKQGLKISFIIIFERKKKAKKGFNLSFMWKIYLVNKQTRYDSQN